MYGDPREFTVSVDRDGFYLVNEFGEEAEVGGIRYLTRETAKGRIHWLVDNDEPRDTPASPTTIDVCLL